MIREHDHFRLCFKVASNAEYNNWLKNRSDEDKLTISGLTCLASFLSKKEHSFSAVLQLVDGFDEHFQATVRFPLSSDVF